MSDTNDHFQEIYANQAPLYDRMVACEDYEGNILPALQKIRSLDGLDVVEFGAGTGRLTRLLVPIVKSIRAFDLSEHMLETARQTLTPLGKNWQLTVGDNGNMPVADNSADLVIAGWSFGHATGWNQDNWREVIDRMTGEMIRIVKPNGTAIILETMGTGKERPAPPSASLAGYYRWLEQDKGFSYSWIRTDYKFSSIHETDELTRFFFGDELANRIIDDELTILPECTGIWWKRV